jgi:hypothetical protein
MALNTVFVAVRAVQASCCLKVTYGQWLITVFSAVTASSCTLVNLNNLAHRHEIIEVINQIWKVNGKGTIDFYLPLQLTQVQLHTPDT